MIDSYVKLSFLPMPQLMLPVWYHSFHPLYNQDIQPAVFCSDPCAAAGRQQDIFKSCEGLYDLLTICSLLSTPTIVFLTLRLVT